MSASAPRGISRRAPGMAGSGASPSVTRRCPGPPTTIPRAPGPTTCVLRADGARRVARIRHNSTVAPEYLPWVPALRDRSRRAAAASTCRGSRSISPNVCSPACMKAPTLAPRGVTLTVPVQQRSASTAAPVRSGPALFEPLALRSLTARNRIAVAPMCQYSCEDGYPTDWHLVHLGSRAVGGAAMVIAEASGVEARGRISPNDAGIYRDGHVDAL